MVLQIAVILTGASLSYVMHRQRMATENHKKAWGNAFIGMLVISAAGSIWLAVRADESARMDRANSAQKASRDSIQMARMQDTVMAVRTQQIQQSFEARVQGLESKVQVSGVQLQLTDFRAAVQPLVDLAEVRYPGLETNVALRQLAADFDGIRAENARLAAIVSEVDRREDFRPLVTPLRDSLKRLLGRAGPLPLDERGSVPIHTNDNRQNRALALEVESLMVWASPMLQHDSENVWGGAPVPGTGRVWLMGPNEMLPRMRALIPALSIIFRDSITVHALGSDLPEYTGLWFTESPRFDSLGRVTFR